VGFILLHLFCKKRRRYEGQAFILYVAWYGLGRAFIEGLRTDSLWLIPGAVRVSQLLAAVSLLCAAVIFLLNELRMRKGGSPLLGTPLTADSGAPLDSDDIIKESTQQPTESERPEFQAPSSEPGTPESGDGTDAETDSKNLRP